ncbi:MAG: hypothetical protein K2N05_05805 [Muribaculaceae bacterium]|nr:hypothetical protein [Muribaculaceae bacterium]
MTSQALTSRGFSFRRSMEFGAYYMTRLKKQLIIYFITSIICALIALVPAPEKLQVGLFVMIWTLLPLLFYCAPLIFAKGADSRIIDRLIPVTTGEKMLFFYLYILVAIPAAVFILPILSGLIYTHIPALQQPGVMQLYELKFSFIGILNLINIVGGCFVAMACFYCVEYARHNRLLWGIVGVVAANTTIGFLGAILGGVAAFSIGYQDGLNGVGRDEMCVEELTRKVMQKLSMLDPMSITVFGILLGVTMITGFLTYRTLKKRNL